MAEIPVKSRILRERRTLIALLALGYTALFMPCVIAVQPVGASAIALLTMVLGAYVYSWAFFFTLRCWRPLFAVLAPFLFFVSAIASYFIWQYQFEMTFQQLAVVTEVETRTALAFVSWRLVAWVVLATLIGIWLTRHALRHEEPDPKDARLLFITAILMLCVFTTEVGTITQRYFPYNLLFAVKDFTVEKMALARGTKHADTPVTYDAKQPVAVILVVGESVRAKNWGLNGYARQTTPLLAKRAGVVNFTDVKSCYPLTRIAVPCVLNDDALDGSRPAEYSLLRLFRQMGFFTASIDMHGMSESVFGSPVAQLFNEGNRLISFNGSMLSENNVDDAGVAALRALLSEHQENLFVFFHPFGSHWPYDTRYPAQFRQWKPVCNPADNSLVDLAKDMSQCVPQELVNAYDNSILYADFILDAVMESVKGRPALVIYTSDHGQTLGENGLFLHGHANEPIERHVPLVAWATPEFHARFPGALARMHAQQALPTSHDAIFHTLPHCIGAKGAMIDPNQSLCH